MGYFTDYPKHVFLILSNEFCERFSFYGMKAILVIYLTDALKYSEENAVSIYHAFNMLCYFTPVLGAMIADGWLGKYKTIAYVSILYLCGNILMAVTSIPLNDGEWIRWPPFIALVVIAFGTGGIKPCVSSFGGDQFSADQQRQKDSFFSLFYMSINIGSLLSTFITPLIRGNVKCFGEDCFAVAFGIPACLMAVSIVLFFIGTPWYTKNPAGESILVRMFGCIGRALKGKCSCSKQPEDKKDHWLDYASPKYDDQFIQDVKDVMRVCWLFIPLPVFWALFDQQSSLWIFQARTLDGKFGDFVVEPDMMPIFNPLLVVIMVPILESLIYPCLDKLKIPNRPLQRMTAGMVMAAIAFIMAGFVQLAIDNESPPAVQSGQIKFNFINTANCPISIEDTDYGHLKGKIIPPFENTDYYYVSVNEINYLNFDASECNAGPGKYNYTIDKIDDERTYQFVLSQNDVNRFDQTELDFASGQRSTVRFYNSLNDTVNITIIQGTEKKPKYRYLVAPPFNFSFHDEMLLEDFKINLTIVDGSLSEILKGPMEAVLHEPRSENGAVYTMFLNQSTSGEYSISQLNELEPRGINIFLQVPQYFVITLGETLFSVTGLGFAYTQAAPSMKSILTAVWLLTVALGNVLVIVVELAASAMSKMAVSFLFAGLMIITTVIFAIMAMFYEYVEPRPVESHSTEPISLTVDEHEKDNRAFANDDDVNEKKKAIIDADEISIKSDRSKNNDSQF